MSVSNKEKSLLLRFIAEKSWGRTQDEIDEFCKRWGKDKGTEAIQELSEEKAITFEIHTDTYRVAK